MLFVVVDVVVFVCCSYHINMIVTLAAGTRCCLTGSPVLRSVFLFAEVKALMAYDEDTEENASESNEDQDQAAVVAAKKNE